MFVRFVSDVAIDVQQFVHTVAAGVPRENALQATLRQSRAHTRIVAKRTEVPGHLRTVARDEEISPGVKEIFSVVPRSGN